MKNRWNHAPPGSHWGEFGPDDRLGRMNLVDARKVRQGVAEVREGLAFCLSLPLDLPGGRSLNPRRMPPRLFATVRDGAHEGDQGHCWPYAHEDPLLTDVVCDEALLMSTQYSTQWDGLSHMGSLFDADGDGVPEAVFYNGYRAGTDIRPGVAVTPGISSESGAGQRATGDGGAGSEEAWARYPDPDAGPLSVANLAEHGVQGRGVLVDVEAVVGRRRVAVGYDDWMRALEAGGVGVEAGDMVCVHTGFADMLMGMAGRPDPAALHAGGSGLDGADARLLNWIVDSRLACLIADNPAVELMPGVSLDGARVPIRQARLPLHEHCLFRNGIHLGELWWLTPLARWLALHGRRRFLLTAPPLRLRGAAGSPVTPVATV